MTAYTGADKWKVQDSTNGKIYTWNFPIGASDTVTSPTFNLVHASGFSVSVELESAAGDAQATAWVDFDFGQGDWPRTIPHCDRDWET